MLKLVLALTSLAAALAVAGCTAREGTLIVKNRTTEPLVLHQASGSTLVVDACTERTVTSRSGIWSANDSGDLPREWDRSDVDVYRIPLQADWLKMPMEYGVVNATLLVTEEGIGVDQEGYTPRAVAGGGPFPVDPGRETCAGVPPAMPGGWPGSTVDTEPPSSEARALDPVTTEAWTSIACTARDDSEVATMHLWRRFRSQPTDRWGPWTANGVQPTCPFVIWLDAGVGHYEFATVAGDRAGNRETLPEVGDAAIQRLPDPDPLPSPSS